MDRAFWLATAERCSWSQALGMKDKRPKLLFKKFLYTKHDEKLIIEKAYVHLFFIQAVNDVQRGNYLCKSSDAVKLAAIHYYSWHGAFDPNAEQFKISYLKDLRLGEQLMPTPLITAQVVQVRVKRTTSHHTTPHTTPHHHTTPSHHTITPHHTTPHHTTPPPSPSPPPPPPSSHYYFTQVDYEWEPRIIKEHQKISEIFSKVQSLLQYSPSNCPLTLSPTLSPTHSRSSLAVVIIRPTVALRAIPPVVRRAWHFYARSQGDVH